MMHPGAFRLSRLLNALTVTIKMPAVKGAPQSVVFTPPKA
jgi:hypothetical protein